MKRRLFLRRCFQTAAVASMAPAALAAATAPAPGLDVDKMIKLMLEIKRMREEHEIAMRVFVGKAFYNDPRALVDHYHDFDCKVLGHD